jgi:Outer membrane lipoprotein-sorting protein
MSKPNLGRRQFLTLLASLATTASVMASTSRALAEKSQDELLGLLKRVDERQRNKGDWRALLYIEQKEKGKSTVGYEAQVFRRSTDQRFVILFTKPRTSAGQGYLRVDRNIWFYDPAIGRWERRTERERIGGTNSRRSDFDESRLAEEYVPEDAGEAKLGAYTTQVMTLRQREGLDLAFPVVKLWVDVATQNVLKRQEFALSGKLLRTAFYPKWKNVHNPDTKSDVWYPEQIHLFDEIEKENQTLIVTKAVDPSPLEENLFTKAWLESKSR